MTGRWLSGRLWALDAVYDRTAEQIALAVDRLLNHKELTIQEAEVVTASTRSSSEPLQATIQGRRGSSSWQAPD